MTFPGGAFIPKYDGHQAGEIALGHTAITITTRDGTEHALPYADCHLRRGGAHNETIFCRSTDGKLEIFCEQAGFVEALAQAGQGILANQVIAMGRRRQAARIRSLIVASTALVLLTGILIGAYYAIRAGAGAAVQALPTDVDRRIGQAWAETADLGGPEVADPVVTGAVEKVVARLAPHVAGAPFDYNVIVVDAPIENAFAVPGGTIVVYTGLLRSAESLEQVAGVIAHEMAHVTQRHGLERMGQSAGISISISLILGDASRFARHGAEMLASSSLNSYSRHQESEADAVGARAMHAAGIDPVALAEFFGILEKREGQLPDAASWFSTHPDTGARIRDIQRVVAELPPKEYRPLDVDWPGVQQRVAAP